MIFYSLDVGDYCGVENRFSRGDMKIVGHPVPWRCLQWRLYLK